MRTMTNRLALGLLLLVSGGCAQQQNTVYQTVVLNRNTIGTFPVTRNIGQNAHLVAIVAENAAPPTVCGVITGTFNLQGSFNNVDWVTIQQVTINTVTGSAADTRSRSFTGTGAYPYLQINILALSNTTTCSVNIYYSGALNIGTNSSNYTVRQDNFQFVSGVTGVGTGVNLGQCVGSAITAIYGGVIINQNASALAASARIYTISNTFVEELLLPLQNVAGNASLVLSQGPRPYAAVYPSLVYATRDVWIDPGAAGQVRYALVYRCE
jgi:hypothetical protein